MWVSPLRVLRRPNRCLAGSSPRKAGTISNLLGAAELGWGAEPFSVVPSDFRPLSEIRPSCRAPNLNRDHHCLDALPVISASSARRMAAAILLARSASGVPWATATLAQR